MKRKGSRRRGAGRKKSKRQALHLRAWSRIRRVTWKGWLLIGALILILPGLVFFVSFGLRTRDLGSSPTWLRDYRAANLAFGAIRAREGGLPLHPRSHSVLLAHGHRSECVAVLYHGLGSSPRQFEKLGRIIHQQGWNVYIPRMPHHGLADRAAGHMASMTAAELRDHADRSIDIAAGLGEKVVVIGLSAGGVLAAHNAQHRKDVDRVILLAPVPGFRPARGAWISNCLYVVAPVLPDIGSDGDMASPDVPDHCYPGFSSRSQAELLRLGGAVFRASMNEAPAVQDIVLVTTAPDATANDSVNWRLIDNWRSKGLTRFASYQFAADQKIEPDMIDPAHPRQRVDITYPVLLDFILLRDDGDPAPSRASRD